MVQLAPMDNFHNEEDTNVVDVLDDDPEIALSRTTTRPRSSSFVGLVPMPGVTGLPPGTELFGPDGQRGYIAGHTSEGLVIFDLQTLEAGRRTFSTVEARPLTFVGWRTSGGAVL